MSQVESVYTFRNLIFEFIESIPVTHFWVYGVMSIICMCSILYARKTRRSLSFPLVIPFGFALSFTHVISLSIDAGCILSSDHNQWPSLDIPLAFFSLSIAVIAVKLRSLLISERRTELTTRSVNYFISFMIAASVAIAEYARFSSPDNALSLIFALVIQLLVSTFIINYFVLSLELSLKLKKLQESIKGITEKISHTGHKSNSLLTNFKQIPKDKFSDYDIISIDDKLYTECWTLGREKIRIEGCFNRLQVHIFDEKSIEIMNLLIETVGKFEIEVETHVKKSEDLKIVEYLKLK